VPAAIHWDDVEGRRRTVGHLDSTWWDLGSAAGSHDVGVNRIRVEPGAWSTPAHVEHGAIEVDLIPAKIADLGGTQPVPEGQQDHGAIPVPIAIVASSLHQPLNLALGEVFAGAIVGVC